MIIGYTTGWWHVDEPHLSHVCVTACRYRRHHGEHHHPVSWFQRPGVCHVGAARSPLFPDPADGACRPSWRVMEAARLRRLGSPSGQATHDVSETENQIPVRICEIIRIEKGCCVWSNYYIFIRNQVQPYSDAYSIRHGGTCPQFYRWLGTGPPWVELPGPDFRTILWRLYDLKLKQSYYHKIVIITLS